MSQSTSGAVAIPNNLDPVGKFLYWDMDVMAVFMAGMLMGIATDHNVLGVVVGAVLALWYFRVKTGEHPGFAKHQLYWFVAAPNTIALPKSHLRDFVG